MEYLSRVIWMAAAFALPLPAASGIRGSIHDDLGAVIGKATVIVYTMKGDLLKTGTDTNGKYSVEIVDGIQDVFVTGAGFAPTCRKIFIQRDRWTDFSPVLKADPLTIKLRGDTFDAKHR